MEVEKCFRLIGKVVEAFVKDVNMLTLWHQDAYFELKLHAAGMEAVVRGGDLAGRVYIDPFSAVVEVDAEHGKCELGVKNIGSLFVVKTCRERKEFDVVEINGVKYTAEEFYRFIGERFEAISRRMAEYILQRKV